MTDEALNDALRDDVSTEDVIVTAADGHLLAATLFLPSGPVRHAVLITSGTAIPRKVYSRFAAHLAQRGCAVLTFDYRGVGGSRPPGSLKGFQATMTDWAMRDIPAAISFMRARFSQLPLHYVGHSFGGQALGLVPNNTEVSRALLIAAQAGYWKLMAGTEGFRVAALLNGLGVPLTRILGYAPGWAGIGEDLPSGVFLQWVRWIMSPRYLFDDASLEGLANFANFKAPLRALALTDDPWATRPAVELLCSGFKSTTPEVHSIAPHQAAVQAIGHMGFFRPTHRDTLWRNAAEWLLAG